MATTSKQTLLLQHPSHPHSLELQESSINIPWGCHLCGRKISAKAYTCQEGCKTYSCHSACVEAPPRIDRHPLHPVHPLTLIQGLPVFECDACGKHFYEGGSSFRCDECEFDLDIGCALSTLSDEGHYQGGKTSEQITLPFHPHTLTSFSKSHDFVEDNNCYICWGSVRGDGYMCLRPLCKFVIHRRCIQDRYYADGTKAPRVYHGHRLSTFVGEDTCSTRCASCGSDKSGEFIGCASCEVFYHKHCFQVPEILRYPSHNPDHTLVLLSAFGDGAQRCQSCSSYLKNEIYYRCTSCEFFVHVGCAFQVVTYCEEGMSAKIKLSWHKHPLLLCNRTKSTSNNCFYCGDKSIGPTYVCEEKDCGFLLHKRCTEIESTITCTHHPDHPLILCKRDDDDLLHFCIACGRTTDGLKFSCERCSLVGLHVKCAARFPTHKHNLHEHKLLRLEEYMYWECNRCGRSTHSPLFRCVPCDFNLHEECMELPLVVESEIHWHPLTLFETFLEDDNGDYFCEHCEERRDPRLGVYVCGHCKMKSYPRIYHIECALPELGKVYEKKRLPPAAVEKLNDEIADKREEIRIMREKIEEATREMEKLVKERSKILEGEREDES